MAAIWRRRRGACSPCWQTADRKYRLALRAAATKSASRALRAPGGWRAYTSISIQNIILIVSCATCAAQRRQGTRCFYWLRMAMANGDAQCAAIPTAYQHPGEGEWWLLPGEHAVLPTPPRCPPPSLPPLPTPLPPTPHHTRLVCA
jgi:hypothetical protein